MDPVSNTSIVNTERIILINSNQSSVFIVEFYKIDNLIQETPYILISIKTDPIIFPSRETENLIKRNKKIVKLNLKISVERDKKIRPARNSLERKKKRNFGEGNKKITQPTEAFLFGFHNNFF